jgi:hypothetical protein
MVNLLSQYDSDKNNELIKEIIGKAIQNKQKELDKITKELESVEKQQRDGHYFMPLNKDPVISAQYIGQAVISILGAIIDGIGEATEHIKNETIKISQEQNKQVGGSIMGSNQDNTSAKDVTKLADNLTKLIRQSKEIISNLNKSSRLNSSAESGIMSKGFSEAVRMGKIAFFTGLKITESMVNNVINFVLDSTGNENIITTPWQELSPELNKKLILLAGVLKEMSENPATKEAIKEAAKTIAVSTVELMELIEPDINKVTDQAVHMVGDVASKSAHGMASTGISVAQAFLAEIPVVGGILDLTIAIGKGFNALMRVFKVYVSNFSDITVQGVEMAAKIKDKISDMGGIDGDDDINETTDIDNTVTDKTPVKKIPKNENTNNDKNNTNHMDTVKKGFGSFMTKAKSGLETAKQKGKEFAKSDAVQNAQAKATDLANKAQAQAKTGLEIAKQKGNEIAQSDAVQNAKTKAIDLANKAQQKGKEIAESDAVQNAQAKAQDLANKASNQIKSGVESAKDMANKAQLANKVANVANKFTGGGKTMNTRKLRSHIAKSNNRLNKTMKLFHNTLPKMKYSTASNKKY